MGLVPVLWALRGARARRAALLGLVFGLVYFGLVLAWLEPATGVGYYVLVVEQALWRVVLFAFIALVWRAENPIRSAAAIAAGWVTIDWIRGTLPYGGFTFGNVGLTQHDNPFLLPLASVLGVWGISFVIVGVNLLILEALGRMGEWQRAVAPIAVAAGATLLPGAIPIGVPDSPSVDVAIVQGNVPERVAAQSRLIEDRIVADNHIRLHARLAGDPPDLAIWPENALDEDPTRDPTLGVPIRDAIRAVSAPTVIGAITTGDDGRLRNETLLYSPGGEVVDRYVKTRLVPFGEHVPFRRFFSFIPDIARVPRDLTPGDDPGRFEIAAGRLATAICFENTFPDLVREYVDQKTGFVAITTNDSTFLRTSLSEQHVVMSELRAVENGRWVVHAALSGISAIIDERGRVLQRTDLFEQAILRAEVPQASGRTVFNVIGGWVPPLFAAGAALGYLAGPRPRRRRPSPLPAEPRVRVVLPTYDERETIEGVLQRLLEADGQLEVLVVDDSSPDGTGEIVREVAARDGRVTLVQRPGKQGLASAYALGFRDALADGADLIVEMDADLSHRPEDLPALLRAAEDHDLVIGSRYVPGGSVKNWSPVRRLLSRTANLYARVALGLPVADSTSGYRVFRREVLDELLRPGIASEGYAFQIELALRAWRAGFSVGEVPITFEERLHGRSKLSRAIVFEALWRVLAWAVRDRVLRRSPRAHSERR